MTFVGILALFLLFIFLLALLFPVVARSEKTGNYFISGNLKVPRLRQRMSIVRENIRDLNLELSAGKLTQDEYESMVSPLSADLDNLGRKDDAPGKMNRKGFCANCGKRTSNETCPQCGATVQANLE